MSQTSTYNRFLALLSEASDTDIQVKMSALYTDLEAWRQNICSIELEPDQQKMFEQSLRGLDTLRRAADLIVQFANLHDEALAEQARETALRGVHELEQARRDTDIYLQSLENA